MVDVNVGVASATNATDGDGIAQHLFMHLDANATPILFQSKDGTTTVNATNSTVVYAEGTAFEVWMDMRNPADVQIYVNGALVLDATAFDVGNAASVWYLLAHVEKTSAADTYELEIDWLRARIAEQ